MKIFLPTETLSVVKEKYVFVDTCVFLDFAYLNQKGKEAFMDGLNLLTKENCVFMVIEPVAIEFFIGSNEEDLKLKKEYLEKMNIQPILSSKVLNIEKREELLLEYGNSARGNLSYVDLCLGTAVKQFSKSLVMTRNYKDFSERIFECTALFSICLDKDIKTYGFYQYGRKVEKSQKKDEEIPF